MKQQTLMFASMDTLLEFQAVTQTQTYEVNTDQLTLAGLFSDAQLELAQNGYQVAIAAEQSM